MNDRELLELAAKAAGLCIVDWIGDGNWVSVAVLDDGSRWQPLHENQFTDCMGDALRLAVKLEREVKADFWSRVIALRSVCDFMHDPHSATRRAIVRAAAEIGKGMP